MLDKLSKSLFVWVGLLLAVVIAGAIAFAPEAQAESVCDGWTASAPADVPWGASFEITWPPVPGAAGYAVYLTDASGTTVVTGVAGSLTVSSNDFGDGGLLNYTVVALTPEGNVLCSTGGVVPFYTAPVKPPGNPPPIQLD
jgi:photosystem II stability/assembly factor-like uncharacterized protein